jgi:hypothetical protein
MDQLDITLVVVGYLAVAFCIMRFAYPRMKSEWMRKSKEIDNEQVFNSVMVGLLFPLFIVLCIGYYILKGCVWLITYQNHG